MLLRLPIVEDAEVRHTKQGVLQAVLLAPHPLIVPSPKAATWQLSGSTIGPQPLGDDIPHLVLPMLFVRGIVGLKYIST